MTELELFRVRIALIQVFLRENGYDGVLLTRSDNFAMATGGKRNHVYTASDLGACSIFVTKGGEAHYVGNNIEETRVMAEELGALGCGVRRFLWTETTAAEVVRKEFPGTLVSDDGSLGENVHGKMTYLRALLTLDELEKFRRLGRLASEAMTATLGSIEAGMAEADIAARLVAEGSARRCIVPISLIAADERIATFRHPLPTEVSLLGGGIAERAVRGYVMVVLCLIKEGLVVSITRFKRVGDVPEGVPGAYDRVCGVDALMQEATQPGKTLGDVFAVCRKAYADLGFPANEWHNHHQGGAGGYAGRTCKGTPGETFPILDARWSGLVHDIAGVDVQFGHAFAWNPSAVGVKSEDTFIMLPDGAKEIVTGTPALPTVDLAAVLGRPTDVVKSGMAGA